MKRLSMFCLLMLCACASEVTKPQPLKVSAVGEMYPLLAQVRGLALSGNLGWVEYARTWHVQYQDGTEALLIPVEAEDEIRTIAVLFHEGMLQSATVLGFAETNWFSRSRAESLQTYEGWMFCYDLSKGQRRISAYYEAGHLRQHESDYPEDAVAVDMLRDSERFACLALASAAPPQHVTPRIFLHEDEEGTMQQIALEVHDAFFCR